PGRPCSAASRQHDRWVRVVAGDDPPGSPAFECVGRIDRFVLINKGSVMNPERWKTLAVALAVIAWHLALAAPAARGQWNAWAALGDQKFDAGVGITALMPRAGQVNLIGVGKNRKVYTNTWLKEKGWQ